MTNLQTPSQTMGFFENNSVNFVMLIGLGLITAILLRRSARYWKAQKRQENKPVKKSGASNSGRQPLIDAPPEIIRWDVEMHETARELKAEIDSKLVALQTLLGMVRQETDRLEAALGRVEGLDEETSAAFRLELDEARRDDLPSPPDAASPDTDPSDP